MGSGIQLSPLTTGGPLARTSAGVTSLADGRSRRWDGQAPGSCLPGSSGPSSWGVRCSPHLESCAMSMFRVLTRRVLTSPCLLLLLGSLSWGCGGDDPAPHPVHRLPERVPEITVDLPTLQQAALIYRLSGDYNPLHADPQVARKAGFERPILHGLCTLGIATHAILKTCCEYNDSRLRSLRLRFSAPVYPGETIRTEIWRDDSAEAWSGRVFHLSTW